MPSATHPPKRLILCCDGTWMASDQGKIMETAGLSVPSNAARISRAIAFYGTNERQETVPQIVYYHAGIGTGSIVEVQQLMSGAFGMGLNDDVAEIYNFISNNWTPGDEIFFFGFSRGAYTVRATAGLIGDVGIASPGQMDQFPDMYQAYQQNKTGKPFHETEEYKKFDLHWQKDVTIKVVGVWDTVGELGIPSNPVVNWLGLNSRYEFYNTAVAMHCQNAFQALALDEHRKSFTPTLWYLPEGHRGTLRQCWFPGVHTNIGGGAADTIELHPKGDLGEISDITFAWMYDQVSPFLTFAPKAIESIVKQHTASLLPPPPNKHEMRGWGCGPIIDSDTGIYRILGSVTRTPGQYKEAGKTNEYIHPSVRIRRETRKDYRKPLWPALSNYQCIPRVRDQNGPKGFVWMSETGEKKIEVPEYVIPESVDGIPSLDRILAGGKIMSRLDAENGLE